MENIRKIFISNPKSSYKVLHNKGTCVFVSHDTLFSGRTISEILCFINAIHNKYKKLPVPIVFSFDDIELADKLSYIIFECICYSLMNDYKHLVSIYWHPKNEIWTEGISSSPLKLLNTKNKESAIKFLTKFKLDIYQKHFRRVVSGTNKENTNYLGKLLQELDSFLKFFNIIEEYRDQISEVITELVGNACEHGDSDCLLDIDITDDHLKEIKNVPQDGFYYGINIAIVNFSDILLGDGIKEKIDTNNLITDRYIELGKAYLFHKQHFSETYLYSDFCNISALQDKISGRPKHGLSGGTGLTKLIYSLQEKSDSNECYVLSGDRTILFIKDYLKYNEDSWLGFNKENNFLNGLPEKNITTDCDIFFPGTAYNLNFIMKREDEKKNDN